MLLLASQPTWNAASSNKRLDSAYIAIHQALQIKHICGSKFVTFVKEIKSYGPEGHKFPKTPGTQKLPSSDLFYMPLERQLHNGYPLGCTGNKSFPRP